MLKPTVAGEIRSSRSSVAISCSRGWPGASSETSFTVHFIPTAYSAPQLYMLSIGTRTIIAIKLDQKDPRNYNGPPYSIAEHVMDEYDLVTCYPTKALRDEQFDDVNDGPV